MKVEICRPDMPCFAEVERLQLSSKFRAVHLLLGTRRYTQVELPVSTVAELTNLCLKDNVPMRWSFVVGFEESRVSYTIPMHDKDEA
jgi:hypothetical protein